MESALCGGADDPGLRLIETALWDGAGCPRIEGHLARLAAGAAALGWPCDPAQARAALRGPGGEPARLRLTLDRQGRIAVAAAPLPPPIPVWRLGLAAERLRSDDPWLRVKSTRRAAYDAARGTLAPGLDEAVLLNERDEVCDGTIATVFFDHGDGLRTPPLSAGLLPGVLRAELIASGCCREETLRAEDLPRVRLWIGNSVRGLCAARWA